MKAKFTAYCDGCVSVEFDDYDFDTCETVRKTRTFSCPASGGYVFEHMGRGQTQQVCKGLSYRGSTLYCSGSLLAMIRREYQAMIRVNKRGSCC